MKTWLIPVLRRGKYNMSLGHRVVPESKEDSKNDSDTSKGHRNQIEKTPPPPAPPQANTLNLKINDDSKGL